MSDALCGPSNPLQQFKQQTQLDRSLQQDRLSSRHPPNQGFRSIDPNAGLLDPEFEAFQAGVPLPDLPHIQHQQPYLNGPSQTPSWATDFQSMQIAPPTTAVQQRQIPRLSSPKLGWANGFQEHMTQSAPRAQTSTQSPQAFQQKARYGMSNYQGNHQSNFPQSNFKPIISSKGKAPAVEQFDNAAFERAFDQASLEVIVDVETNEAEKSAYEAGASTANFGSDYETYSEQQNRKAIIATGGQQRHLSQGMEAQALADATQVDILDRLQDEPMIEQERMNLGEEQRTEEQQHQADDDALAATAKELLEKVEHNQSEKFKNSQFLGLMRKLRDREMRVEGDEMVETVRATPKPFTPTQDSTYGSSTPTPDPLLHRPSHQTPPTPMYHHMEGVESGENHSFDHWESPYR